MSWIFREHRGNIIDSMETAKEFDKKEEMMQYIYDIHKKFAERIGYKDALFVIEDIVINENDFSYDDRAGWNTIHVCVKKYGYKDYMKLYGCPQCIGMCAKDYNLKRYNEWLKENNVLL